MDFPFSTIALDAVYTIAADMTGAGFRFQAAAGRRFVTVIDRIAARDFGTKDTDVLGRFELVLNLTTVACMA